MQKILKENCLMKKAMNTPGAIEVQSKLFEKTDKENRHFNHDHLMEKVVAKDNMTKAYNRVKANKGAPGIDKMEVQNLKGVLIKEWETIKSKLLNGTYKPNPVRRVEIPKPDGGMRQLGIPTVVDRLIQQAVSQVLTPIFDPLFSENSYGFRPKRSAKQSVKTAQGYILEGHKYVVDIDIEKFFDEVNHDKLIAKLSKTTKDRNLIVLIRKYLRSGVMINGCCVITEEGTPQGGPLSPLLANIVLDDLDKELEKRCHKFVRYADDCNIYVKSKRAGERVLVSISRFIERKLKLRINQDKSGSDLAWKRKILGFSFIGDAKMRIKIHSKSIERFKARIRKLTSRSWGISMEARILKLNLYMKGWFEYFKLAEIPRSFEDLDGWIRRRLRACLLKQWKTSQNKVRMLVKNGLTISQAWDIGKSRKKYWRLSLTQQLHKAIGKRYWSEVGLISLAQKYQVDVNI